MLKTVYINKDDDLAAILTRIKKAQSSEVVLVCPKGSLVFEDVEYLSVLLQKTLALQVKTFILTLDETGIEHAKLAGFPLKYLPGKSPSTARKQTSFHQQNHSKLTSSQVVPPPSPQEESTSDSLSSETADVDNSESASGRISIKKISEIEMEAVAVAGNDVFLNKTNERHLVNPALTGPGEFSSTRLNQLDTHDNYFGAPHDLHTNRLFENKLSTRSYASAVWLTCFLLLIIVLVAAILVPQAEILLYPKNQAIIRDVDISMSVATQAPDTAKLLLPATAISEKVAISAKLSATGKVDLGSKARGEIKIYNTSGKPITLKKLQTDLVANGQHYTLLADVDVVSPVESTNLDLSSPKLTSATIEASEVGENSNIPAGVEVKIINSNIKTKDGQVSGKTSKPVLGGSIRFVPQVSKDDEALAQQELTNLAGEKLAASYRQQGLNLIPGAFEGIISDFTMDKPVGTQTSTFSASGSVSLRGLVFREADLVAIIRQRVAEGLPVTRVQQEPSLDELSYQVKSFNPDLGLLTVSVGYRSKSYAKNDLSNLVDTVVGRNPYVAEQGIAKAVEVEKIEVNAVPNWLPVLPVLKSHIKIREIR